MIQKKVVETLVDIINKFKCDVRLHWDCDTKIEVSQWDKWAIIPSDSYLELPSVGPVNISSCKVLEIKTKKTIVIGRLIEPKVIDYSEEIKELLFSNGIDFDFFNSIIKVKIH